MGRIRRSLSLPRSERGSSVCFILRYKLADVGPPCTIAQRDRQFTIPACSLLVSRKRQVPCQDPMRGLAFCADPFFSPLQMRSCSGGGGGRKGMLVWLQVYCEHSYIHIQMHALSEPEPRRCLVRLELHQITWTDVKFETYRSGLDAHSDSRKLTDGPAHGRTGFCT